MTKTGFRYVTTRNNSCLKVVISYYNWTLVICDQLCVSLPFHRQIKTGGDQIQAVASAGVPPEKLPNKPPMTADSEWWQNSIEKKRVDLN